MFNVVVPDIEAVPRTSKVDSGEDSLMPTLPFSNTVNLELEPDATLNKVEVSPTMCNAEVGEVVPMPTLPDAVILPDGKEKPLESSNEPEKELDAVLVEYIGPER